MGIPETRYARSGDVHIAYSISGDGPLDLVFVPGWASNLETTWEYGPAAAFLERLGTFSRVILFDKRGTGMSDRVSISELPTLEQRMDDVRAVMDAAGSERAALFGVSEGGPMAILFAATYPERVIALVMHGSYAKYLRSDDYPWAPPREYHDRAIELYDRADQTLGSNLSFFAPSMAEDPEAVEWWARAGRSAASPGAAVALLRMSIEIDVRPVLGVVATPTLITHRVDDRIVKVENARYLADHIPGAKLAELPGDDHVWFAGDIDELAGVIEEFLTGQRQEAAVNDRVLATVLFTDFVQSTARAAEVGDRRWAELLDAHDALARRQVERYRGRLIKSTGDGILATFDGPARAVQCALALREGCLAHGLETRAGVHTGEVELRGGDVSGLAVNIASRIEALAETGEVLVSGTVVDLAVGSGIEFDDRGAHELKGVPGHWRIAAVTSV